MAEQKPPSERAYKVLVPRPPDDPALDNPLFVDLGAFVASSAEASIAKALDGLSKSDAEGVKDAVAVPIGNWNECEVEEDPRPRFKVRRKVGADREPQAGDAQQGEPEPDPEP